MFAVFRESTDGPLMRAIQVEHLCGHVHTHLVPGTVAPDRLLDRLTRGLSSNPCPACVAGAPAWAIEPVLGAADDSEALPS